jgi:hypothetical protein
VAECSKRYTTTAPRRAAADRGATIRLSYDNIIDPHREQTRERIIEGLVERWNKLRRKMEWDPCKEQVL